MNDDDGNDDSDGDCNDKNENNLIFFSKELQQYLGQPDEGGGTEGQCNGEYHPLSSSNYPSIETIETCFGQGVKKSGFLTVRLTVRVDHDDNDCSPGNCCQQHHHHPDDDLN